MYYDGINRIPNYSEPRLDYSDPINKYQGGSFTLKSIKFVVIICTCETIMLFYYFSSGKQKKFEFEVTENKLKIFVWLLDIIIS